MLTELIPRYFIHRKFFELFIINLPSIRFMVLGACRRRSVYRIVFIGSIFSVQKVNVTYEKRKTEIRKTVQAQSICKLIHRI